MGEKNNINVKIENHGVIPKEEEHATPEELYSRLIDKIKRYHPSAGDLSAIDKAYNFAKKSHGDQKRKSGAVSYTHLDASNFDIKKLMREPYYTHEKEELNDLLIEMRNNEPGMCIVLDEYGQAEGLITLEDIVEEIIGDIHDEFCLLYTSRCV